MKTCEYCAKQGGGENCDFCGAPYPVVVEKDGRKNIFTYNGLIVISEHDWCMDSYIFSFYAGDRLLERIPVDYRRWRQEGIVKDGVDSFDLVWKLFEIAHGDRDRHIIAANAAVRDTYLLITRVSPPPITWEQILKEYQEQVA